MPPVMYVGLVVTLSQRRTGRCDLTVAILWCGKRLQRCNTWEVALNVTENALTLQELANVALVIAARDGEPVPIVARSDMPGWRVGAEDADLSISLAGLEIPHRLDEEIVPPSQVPDDRDWRGAYRLIVRAPLIVFDIAWNPGEPLRIMSFSRGDWEKDLVRIAG